ncbi:aspartate carbamoyltransferase catalytic subunit [bacterium]|nr:aspartate carbamoyltransferase catalytic subunit [bacterium]NIN92827.1 aspartate carbamoyltransferase catalytic subunit [bacterium]NIO18782.1 aspartate carbamoyltransferase catalytic subunit [bacterium]NIO73863.1 aspartate carbamoyltransferase catalytic subunit [bacterium]
MRLKNKDLLGLEYLDREEINLILETAKPFKELFTRSVKKVPPLRGKTVVLLFYEPSTRTRTSFELAAKRLSADVLNISASTSSVAKGESLIDTAKTLEAMKADFVVIRHSMAGAPQILARTISASIVNAGDGTHEHPTQGLLDMFTIWEKKGRLSGLKVAIVGDILHSRVARSNIWGLNKMGAKVYVVGPATLIPPRIEQMGVKIFYDLDEIIDELDVINILRIQMERQKENLFPSLREYNEIFGVTDERLKRAKKDLLVMHPGPMNRGIEISSSVAEGSRSVITEQVTNGIAVRMAVLYLLAGGDKRGMKR